MIDQETVTTTVIYESAFALTTTGPAPLDRDRLALRAIDRFDDAAIGHPPKVLRVIVGDAVYDPTGQPAPPSQPTASADEQLEQVRFLLADLRTGYPNPTPYDTASVVIERLTRILEPGSSLT